MTSQRVHPSPPTVTLCHTSWTRSLLLKCDVIINRWPLNCLFFRVCASVGIPYFLLAIEKAFLLNCFPSLRSPFRRFHRFVTHFSNSIVWTKQETQDESDQMRRYSSSNEKSPRGVHQNLFSFLCASCPMSSPRTFFDMQKKLIFW